MLKIKKVILMDSNYLNKETYYIKYDSKTEVKIAELQTLANTSKNAEELRNYIESNFELIELDEVDISCKQLTSFK